MILALGQRYRCIRDRLGDVDGFAILADILSQELFADGESILHFQRLALNLVHFQLHLQQVIAGCHACIDAHRYVLLHLFQHLVNSAQRDEFFLQRHHLPEVLLGGQFHLILRGFQLDATGLHAHFSQLVAIDDLPSRNDWLHGHDVAHDTILYHAHVRRHRCPGGQHGGHLCGKIHFHLHQVFVGRQSGTHGRHLREVVGECLFLLLLSLLDVVASRAQGDIVLTGQLFALVKGEGRLGSDCPTTYPTKEKYHYLFHCLSFFFSYNFQ